MAAKLIDKLANFTADAKFDALPIEVVDECRRLILDSIGCSLAGIDQDKGRIACNYARGLGAATEATIFGSSQRSSVVGAAFANSESMNALDFDVILFPGHVTPYVLPGALAVAEQMAIPGKDLIVAVAVGHEMSNRFGRAVDNLRDTKDGKLIGPAIVGYSSSIFGATAAVLKMKQVTREIIGNGLSIAGYISPVNSQGAWNQHAPSSTIKYVLAGMMTQSSLTAAYMAEYGHRGDAQLLDDREFGYPRFIGTQKWQPELITKQLGVEWHFPAELSYKPYPSCRILHSPLGALGALLEEHDIHPDEIESIKVWVEGFVEQPVWQNKRIEHVVDAQFSIAHAISLGAQRIPPGKAWQDPEVIFSRPVMNLMDKVTFEVHPDYVNLLSGNSSSRPARVEVKARGNTYVREQRYPKGAQSPDPSSRMTDAELIAKFRDNARNVLQEKAIEDIIEGIMHLERVDNVATLLRKLTGSRESTQKGGQREDATSRTAV